MQHSSNQRLQQPVEELDGHIADLRKRVEFLTGRESTPANSVAADKRGAAPARPRCRATRARRLCAPSRTRSRRLGSKRGPVADAISAMSAAHVWNLPPDIALIF